MKAVGDLPRLRRALTCRLSIQAAAVPADDFYGRMIPQPRCRRRLGAVGQHVHYHSSLEVHHERAIAGSAPPTPIVDSSHSNGPMRDGSGMLFEVAQNAVIALRKAKTVEQALGRPPSGSMGDKPDHLRHPTRLSCVCCYQRRTMTGERSTGARSVAAAPAKYSQAQLDGSSLYRQVLQTPHIDALETPWPEAAIRTGR